MNASQDQTTSVAHHFGTGYGGTAAENYEQFFVPRISEPLAHDLIDIAALRAGERVLDVACGTGVVTRLAAQRVGTNGSVTGLDLNAGMLAVARSVPAPTRIEWREASAEALPFPDGSFDVVLCQLGLQFVPDTRAALGEMRRVLVPGGRLLVNVPGPPPPPIAILEDALARHIGAPAATFVRAVFSLRDADDLQQRIGTAGFRDVAVQQIPRRLRLPSPKDFLWQYVYSTPLAAMVLDVADERRGALESEVVGRSHPFVEAGDMMLDLDVIVATAQA